MLNISSQSWHYRLRASIFDSKPKDLCSYFWSVVAAALARGLAVLGHIVSWCTRPVGGPSRFFRAVFFFVIACYFLYWIIRAIYVLITDPSHFFWSLLMVLGIIFAIALVAAIVILALAGLSEWRKRHRRKHPKKPAITLVDPEETPEDPGESTWNIFWTFLRSKKRKVCPLIVVDNGSEGIEKPLVNE